MTYENPRDPRDPNVPVARGRPAQSFGGWLPLAFAAVVAARSAHVDVSQCNQRPVE